MYSSSINTIYTPFPQLASTIHGLSPPNFFSQERDSAALLQNRQDLLNGLFFPSNAAAARRNNVAANKPPQISSKKSSKKKNINISKKDRHSKIFTAQGPRDRRVRLSMDIARKFFDLQDLLGFDKASKTLEWLLTNSKDSIKELVHMKTDIIDTNTNSNSTGCLFEMVYNNGVVGNEKIRDAFDMCSRKSRAKARARARDRTREKMLAREINMGEDQSSLRMDGQDLTTTSPNQSPRSWPQIDDDHIPVADIWDISTDLIPAEFQYHGKPWDICNNHTIPVD